MDCNIGIMNNWITGMQLVNSQIGSGHFDPPPPAAINPGQLGSFILRGNPFEGPSGSATYQFSYSSGDLQLTATVEFIFANPVSGSNVVDWKWINLPQPRFNGTIVFYAKSDTNPWLLNSVEPGGNPVDAVYRLFGQGS